MIKKLHQKSINVIFHRILKILTIINLSRLVFLLSKTNHRIHEVKLNWVIGNQVIGVQVFKTDDR